MLNTTSNQEKLRGYVLNDTARARALERRITNYLGMRQLVDRESIQVRVISGTAIVRGRVMNERNRFRICECCRHVAGVYAVIDQIEVTTPKPGPGRHLVTTCAP